MPSIPSSSRAGASRPGAGPGEGSSSDPMSWIENLIGGDGSGGNLSPMTKQMIIGGVSGWVTGFLSMKIGKAAATALGGGIILLQIANHQGYIKINWSRLQRDMEGVTTKITEVGEQKKNWTEKVERKLEKMADKAESVVNRMESRSRKWYDKILGRETRDLRIFLTSFAVGTTIGIVTGG